MATILRAFNGIPVELRLRDKADGIKLYIDNMLTLPSLTDTETDALRQLYDDISDAMGRFTKTLEGER